MFVFESTHFFSNRLYFDTKGPISECPKGKEELLGAGVRSYSLPVGWFLSLIGLATIVPISGKDFYINNRSFCKLILRIVEGGNRPLCEDAQKLHRIFLTHREKGKDYDPKQVERLNNKLKQIAQKTRDLAVILRSC